MTPWEQLAAWVGAARLPVDAHPPKDVCIGRSDCGYCIEQDSRADARRALHRRALLMARVALAAVEWNAIEDEIAAAWDREPMPTASELRALVMRAAKARTKVGDALGALAEDVEGDEE